MNEAQGKPPKRGWGIVGCVVAYVFGLGGVLALYGFLQDAMRGTLAPLPGDTLQVAGMICGGMVFYGLGLACGLIAATRYRISWAWPAVGLCGLWMVVGVVQYMIRATPK